MRARPAIPWLVLVFVLVLSGCGGGADEPATGQGATTATAATTAAPATTGTVAQQAPQTERQRVDACLREEGYRLTGGAPQSRGADAPDYQIIFQGSRGGGYIGFYKNVGRARRVAARLRTNARRAGNAGTERHGTINIVWVDLDDRGARARVRACLVT